MDSAGQLKLLMSNIIDTSKIFYLPSRKPTVFLTKNNWVSEKVA
jgi:hypothetical protein